MQSWHTEALLVLVHAGIACETAPRSSSSNPVCFQDGLLVFGLGLDADVSPSKSWTGLLSHCNSEFAIQGLKLRLTAQP